MKIRDWEDYDELEEITALERSRSKTKKKKKVKEKKKKWFINKVEVRESTVHIGGHGVFATELIKKHEVFESSPVLTWHFSFLRD